jgi:hypothetical protein
MRKFLIKELKGDEHYHYKDFENHIITKAELTRRICWINAGDYRDGDIDILTAPAPQLEKEEKWIWICEGCGTEIEEIPCDKCGCSLMRKVKLEKEITEYDMGKAANKCIQDMINGGPDRRYR